MAAIGSTLRDEQGLWGAVAQVAAEKQVDGAALDSLRLWAGARARDLPHTVFDKHQAGCFRTSFRAAIGHAADELIAGRRPE